MQEMKRLTLFTLILFGCGQVRQQDENAITESLIKKDSVTEQKISNQTIVQSDTSPKPTAYFLNFTNYLDSIGYIADTVRAKKIFESQLCNRMVSWFT